MVDDAAVAATVVVVVVAMVVARILVALGKAETQITIVSITGDVHDALRQLKPKMKRAPVLISQSDGTPSKSKFQEARGIIQNMANRTNGARVPPP